MSDYRKTLTPKTASAFSAFYADFNGCLYQAAGKWERRLRRLRASAILVQRQMQVLERENQRLKKQLQESSDE